MQRRVCYNLSGWEAVVWLGWWWAGHVTRNETGGKAKGREMSVHM